LGHEAAAHQQLAGLIRAHGQQGQAAAALFEPQPVAAGQVLVADAQRVAVAVEIAAADAGEVEAIQGRIDQSVRALLPAARLGLKLLKHQQRPVAGAHRLGQHREAAAIQGTTAEQADG